jgi:hypothetical protein
VDKVRPTLEAGDFVDEIAGVVVKVLTRNFIFDLFHRYENEPK